jgi:hypothetical protein
MSFSDRASQKGCYRFLHHPKVTELSLINEMTDRCSKTAKGRHLIVIQDSSSFNLNNHYYRIKKNSGIGTIEDNLTLGFFMHASLVMDAFTETMLGFSGVQLWHRVYDDPNRGKHISKLPIEKKESYKWIRACEQTKQKFTDAASITFVEDRDGDIYEQFVRIADSKTHFVIRSCKERKLENGNRLYETLHKQKVSGSYLITVVGDVRKKKQTRKALIDVRFKKVSISRSSHCINKNISDNIELFAVEAEERNYNGKDKICWRLLTTHGVTCFEDAVNVIEYYRRRWYIEQLFRLLKKQGFALEESQLESGWAIRKLAVLALNAALRVMQLMHASEEETAQPLDEVFTKQEHQCLIEVNHQLKGKTKKQSNPYKEKTLLWAKWIIARLGGWKGYSSQRTPGPITLKRGLDNFTQIFNGWCLALKLYEDVGTQ